MIRSTSVCFILFALLCGCSSLFNGPETNTVASTPREIAPASQTNRAASDSIVTVDRSTLDSFNFLSIASPRADQKIIEGFARTDAPLSRYGIDDTPEHLIHFLAQSATETGGFRTLRENMSYSAERLLEVFPTRVTAAQARTLARKPRETANHVYGSRLGNRSGTDDGWNFRGSGYLQLTGRSNFEVMGRRLQQPLAVEPDSVRLPIRGLDASLEFWKWRGVDRIVANGTIAEVRRAVNGGTNGLPEARVWHAVILDAYRSRGGVRSEAGGRGGDPVDEAVAQALSDYGFLEGPDPESAVRDGRYSEALAKFQLSRGLEPTGQLDADTLYAITDPTGKFDEF